MGAAGDDPVKQGQLLREALTEHVRLAKKTGQFRRQAKWGLIDAGETLKQYLPEGCAFDYAENVLRSAGFALAPRPTPDSPGILSGSEFAFDVNAVLGGYGRERFEGVECIVALRPAAPYDYSTVHRVLSDCSFSLLSFKT
jgi:hypothetical protein